ncbi:methyltransferase-like protein 5 [Acyrthosiphon pisum]|uniref:Methyltransferase small domain-containing protein n=1 Tax=Acyrthosiphon pisum TaxID=7029 RepID=A0A8R2JWF1_ACYPI|nr:methyltransferase-like protein 5 [Acyrthosiphon pisum]|eukprot:XP_001942649.1 PREDICTED: methyltransferase-like protein 5 [Acyrthosiphon pisum]
MASMKLKTLQHALKDIKTFENPKIELEQYTTSSDIAACILHTAQLVYNDISGKCVADLGCGSGVLCIGAALLGARYCAGFDIDASAISLSVENAADRDVLGKCDFILCDVKKIDQNMRLKAFDTVIMNPPFGTREREADLIFLKMALSLATEAVYSLHERSTRKRVLRMAKKLGANAKVIAELRFDLPASYKFHRQDSLHVQVDLIRFALPLQVPVNNL